MRNAMSATDPAASCRVWTFDIVVRYQPPETVMEESDTVGGTEPITVVPFLSTRPPIVILLASIRVRIRYEPGVTPVPPVRQIVSPFVTVVYAVNGDPVKVSVEPDKLPPVREPNGTPFFPSPVLFEPRVEK
jgi:hypothetical protein